MDRHIESKRGKEKFQHDGFLYVFERFNANKDIKFWRCEFFNVKGIKCRGRLHVDLAGNVLKQIGEHECPSGAENLEAKKVLTNLKRRAVETMEPACVLRAIALQNIPTPVLATVPNKSALKKVVKRARRDIDAPPAIPNTLADLQIPENYQFYKRSDELQERFLLADSGVYIEDAKQKRILIFGRASVGQWSNQIKDIYCDGTFAISPSLFSQVYVILARRQQWVFPILYCLLVDKTEATYNRMWELIRELWNGFSPNTISIDFEMAAINSIRNNFPQADLRGCLFHLVKNLKKCIAQHGLMQRYQTDPNFACHARMITSIAFLPYSDISLAILALDSQDWIYELDHVLNWFITNYTGRIRADGTRTVAPFPPEFWSVHHRVLIAADRTNNYAEASHRRLKQAFGCAHPTIWRFIDTLRREQKARDADMAKCIAGEEPPQKARRYRDADTRIYNLIRNYRPLNNENPHQLIPGHQYPIQPIIDFLTGISYNYQMDQ